MEELGLGDPTKELLIGLKGHEVKELYANPSQVALVCADQMVDLQPSCARVEPGRSTDEACFAAARFAHGHQEELPRTAPLAKGLVLSGLWLVRTRLSFTSADRGRSGWHRRLFGQGATQETREWVSDPDSDAPEDHAARSYLVEAGVVLDFGGRAVAAFCADNDYRFALEDGAVFQDLAEIRRRHGERYRFEAL